MSDTPISGADAVERFEARKRDHLAHALDPAHQAARQGFDALTLPHDALPELDLAEVDLQPSCYPSGHFKGRVLKTPFYIAGMTAGHAAAPELNLRLAAACERRGWILGLGSQRRDLEQSGQAVDRWSELRERYPSLVLVANLGLSQVIRASVESVRRVVQLAGADLLAIHANALQEAIQPEGTPHFKGGLAALGALIEALETPVLLKETGCGMSEQALRKWAPLGGFGVDVSGFGGTHWGRIEGARSPEGSSSRQSAEVFADWGISTLRSVLHARAVLPPQQELWASGGVRNGLDAAKLLYLGAHRVGYAQPALAAALAGEEALDLWMAQQERDLKIALFCTGSRTPEDLRGKGNA